MILLLDLGNTRIKWALAENSHLLAQGSADDAASLNASWSAIAMPQRILGCAVTAPEMQTIVAEQAALRWQIGVEWLVPREEQAGVRNRYREPALLGADRWAALLGAHARFPDTALVVVSAGTALVVDALSAEGVFLGGMILPGYRMMKTALSQGTARLPLACGQFVNFPDNTDDAIETGCLSALVGAINIMCARLGPLPVQIILSGGDAGRLLPLLNQQTIMIENLALHGLAALAAADGENSQ